VLGLNMSVLVLTYMGLTAVAVAAGVPMTLLSVLAGIVFSKRLGVSLGVLVGSMVRCRDGGGWAG
jgi:uncharacterized membrane protein YdjX (TVP38/TMEM64 family)